MRAIERAAARLGLLVERMFDVDDADLNDFYSVSVRDLATAESLIRLLRSLPAVESAYLKPTDSVPLARG
jgi:hypothetical protein